MSTNPSTTTASVPNQTDRPRRRFSVPATPLPPQAQSAGSEQPAPPALSVPEHEVRVDSEETPGQAPPPATDEPIREEQPHQPAPLPETHEPLDMQALMSGTMAVVPVSWLERMLSPAQIDAVITRRATRSHKADRVVTKAHGEPKNQKLKFCPGCALEKNRSKDFYKMSTSKDGYQPRCKECQLESSRKRKASNRKTRIARATETVQRAGLYKLFGKPREVRGRDNIKKVYAFLKRHKTGATAKQIQSDLKMPASTVHWTLAKLQEKRAIQRTAAA